MNFDMTYTEFAILGLIVLSAVALPILLVLSFSHARRLRMMKARAMPLSDLELDMLAGKIGSRIGLGEDAPIHNLSDQMSQIQRDFDWLVSDRMIEQAIDMARLGQSDTGIAQQTGISKAELEAIRKLRKH